MKLVYMGKYSGNPKDIPCEEHKSGAVMFKEPELDRLAVIMNAVSFVITVALIIVFFIRADMERTLPKILQLFLGVALSILTLFPHELLHAVCFKKTVYLYTNLKQGMLFVTGSEDMSKLRFIIMGLLPNIVFGFIPYILFLILPNLIFLGVMGALCTGMGAGDYMNVFNALTQMPKGSRTYLYETHSYWYIPKK